LLRSFSPFIQRHFGLFIKYSLHWLLAFCFLFVYIIVMKQLWVPSYTYFNSNPHIGLVNVTCDKRGDLTEACNAARQVDLWIMGWDHMYPTPEYRRSSECQYITTYFDCPKMPHDGAQNWCFVPMDPEGILSSLPTVLTTFIGFHFGNVLIQYTV
jgi:heparan-alpha-glucosaminide N-acetyltransferase